MHIGENQAATRSKEVTQEKEIGVYRRLREVAHNAFPEHYRRDLFIKACISQVEFQVVCLEIHLHETHIAGRMFECEPQSGAFCSLRGGVINLKDWDTLCFV